MADTTELLDEAMIDPVTGQIINQKDLAERLLTQAQAPAGRDRSDRPLTVGAGVDDRGDRRGLQRGLRSESLQRRDQPDY